MKTSGVGAGDLIRLLRPRAVRLYRDGITVGAFVEEAGDARRPFASSSPVTRLT